MIAQILEAEAIDYELLFVNDGSKDATWPEILLACQRNGGHHHPDLQVWMALAKRLDRGQGEARLPRARGHIQNAPALIVLPGLQALPLPAIQLHGTALLTAFVINISNKPRTGKVLLEIFTFLRQKTKI